MCACACACLQSSALCQDLRFPAFCNVPVYCSSICAERVNLAGQGGLGWGPPPGPPPAPAPVTAAGWGGHGWGGAGRGDRWGRCIQLWARGSKVLARSHQTWGPASSRGQPDWGERPLPLSSRPHPSPSWTAYFGSRSGQSPASQAGQT